MDTPLIIQHLIEIKTAQENTNTRLRSLELAVLGNGQPGLAQKVEKLEAARNRAYGIATAIAFATGIFEWLFHRGMQR